MKLLGAIGGVLLVLGPATAFAGFEAPSPAPQTPQNRQDGRSWDVSIRGFYGADKNAALVPETTSYNGEKDSRSFGGQAKGSWRFFEKYGLSAGLIGSVDVVRYKQGKDTGQTSAPSEYNLKAYSGTIYARYGTLISGMQASVGAALDFRAERWPVVATNGKSGSNDSKSFRLDGDLWIRRDTHDWGQFRRRPGRFQRNVPKSGPQ
jgi:hypothetical protein